MAKRSELAQVYDLVAAGDEEAIRALVPEWKPSGNPITRYFLAREAARVTKSVASGMARAQLRAMEAAEQGTVVSQGMELLGVYGSIRGVAETTGVTFDALRKMGRGAEPAAAIRKRRRDQVAAFARRAEFENGDVRTPGFAIALNSSDTQPSRAQKREMERYAQFIEEAGYTDPPDAEKPVGWQSGFEHFLRALVDDSITLDHTAVRRWSSRTNPGKFPIVAFAAYDAGRVRHVRPWIEKIVDGVPRREEFETPRTNARGDAIRFVAMEDIRGGQASEHFSAAEMFCAMRNPITDVRANGYGESELELAFTAGMGWIYGRDYNMTRFRKDTLPRGMILLQGEMGEQQVQTFRLRWKEMFSGLANRWGIPIFTANSKEAGIQWTPFDLSSRDMEYHQMMFSWALWMHALYGIHPEETGFEALSPFRPPLSEASPETKLKYSQDSGLAPLLRFVEDLMNREILWKMRPDRQYRFRFVGMGDSNELEAAQAAQARLNAGISTPRLELAARDIQVEDWVTECPLLDFPMPLPQSLPLFMSLQQQAQAAEQQKHAMEMQQVQQQQAGDAGRFQAAQGLPQDGAGQEAPGSGEMPMGKERDPAQYVGGGLREPSGAEDPVEGMRTVTKSVAIVRRDRPHLWM